MKRNFKSIVAVILCIVMTFPFSTMASAKVTLPDVPTATSSNVVYVSYNTSAKDGITISSSTSAGGASPSSTYKVASADAWKSLTTTGLAKDGGTIVIVGKTYFNYDAEIAATTTPLVFTSTYDGTDYAPYNEDGSYNTNSTCGQYGSIMITGGKTVTLKGDVIFDDVFLFNRTNLGHGIINVEGKLAVNSNVGFANISDNSKTLLNVAEGAYAYIDALGFADYTGAGTIVIGDEIIDGVTKDTFTGFEGKIINENGIELFADDTTTDAEESTETPEESTETPEESTETPEESTETPEESTETPEESTETPEESTETPEDTTNTPDEPDTPIELPERPTAPENKIYISYDNNATITINATSDGGLTAENPFKTISLSSWTTLYSDLAKDGGKIIIVGKAFYGANYEIPTTSTLLFTGVDGDTNYISYNEDNSYNTVNKSAAEGGGQYGMFMSVGTLTINGSIIFDNTVILNRKTASKFLVNGVLVINDTVDFVNMGTSTYALEVAESGVVFLDTLGFGSYTGTGTIVLSNDVISTATADDFAGFEGKIVDKNGNDVIFGQPPEDTEKPEDTTAPEDTAVPEKPVANGTDKVYISYATSNTNGTGASSNGGASDSDAYLTNQSAGWSILMGLSNAGNATTVEGNKNLKDGGTIVIVGKGFIGESFTFPITAQPVVITGKDGDTNYVSLNEDNSPDTTTQLGMFMLYKDMTLTINGTLIFDNTVILNRKVTNSNFLVNGVLVINNTVDIINKGTSTHTLEVAEGGVAFIDAVGFGNYTGKGTIVVGNSILDQVKKADFANFEGRVIDENGNDIYPGSPASFPSKDNFVYTADDKTATGAAASAKGGATAEAPYKTNTTSWKNLFSGKLADGGYVIVVGKGYFGADCTLPATTKPVVFTALDMDGTTSYISRDENGNLLYMNESGGHAGQYGMFMMAGDTTVEFDGDVIFDNIVILNRVAEENNATIKVNKTLTITNTVQFADMKDEPCDIHISEGAFLYLNADPAGFEIYSGTGTIVIGDGILETAHARHFRDFEGRIVDKYGNDFIVGEKAITKDVTGTCEYEYNWLTDVLTITGDGTPGGLVRARFAKEIIFGEGVKGIPANFCYKNTNLMSVVLSSTITLIANNAFGYTQNLKTLVIPEDSSITAIGDKAFISSGITDVKFNIVETIGAQAFRSCKSLTSVELGSNVKSIGESAFAGNSKLESFIFDGAITAIADNTFEMAVSLKEITLPDSVTTIGRKAFAYSSALTKIDLPQSLVSISEAAFKKTALEGTITLPSSVKTLGSYVFYGCTDMTGIVLPDNLESFDFACFGYSGLTTVSIPASISAVPSQAFRDCTKLTEVSFGEGVASIGDYAFYNTKVTTIVLPEACTALGIAAFRSCVDLTSITINGKITSIPEKAFRSCSSLSSVTISDPSAIGSIGEYAFHGCSSLQSFTLPASLTALGNYCFAYSGLNTVSIPSNVSAIPNYAFRDCKKLTEVSFGEGVASIGDYAFYNTKVTTIALPEACTALGIAAFRSCVDLTSITINGKITSIPEKAFRSCSSLSSVTISDPSATSSIGAQAFHGCSSLQSFTLPSGLTSIGEGCFAYSGITKVELPIAVTSIPNSAFANCSDLTEVTAKGNLTSIDSYAFTACGIVSFVIPQTCTSLGKSIFHGCKNLQTVTIEAPITAIPQKMFVNCSALTTTNIPDSVTDIQAQAYYGCTSLTTISLPSNLNTIGEHSFAQTLSLAVNLTIPGSCNVIGDKCFMNSAITGITISEGVSSIGFASFYNCSNLTSVIIPESCTVLKEKCFAYSSLTEVFISSSVTSIEVRAFDPADKTKPVELHTEADATAVIEWANANDTRVTLHTDYIPA